MYAPLRFVSKQTRRIRDDSKLEPSPIGNEDFLQMAVGKRLYLLSVNLEGIGLSRRLRALGLNVCSFLDSRFSGRERQGLAVGDPDKYIESADPINDLLIVCTKDRKWKERFLTRASNAGFRRHQNLFTPLDICRYFPTVEIEGKCNLVCKTCDMGLPGSNRGRGHMPHSVFQEVLRKMVREIPLMNSVALYTWGEPLLNPEISKIVRECREQGVACEVSTNLDYHKYLDEFLLSEPDQIVAPCAGIREKYERGRTGGSWDKYLKGLYRIAEMRDMHNLDYNVRVMYHLYKDNFYEDLDYMQNLCDKLGFALIPIVAHLFPGQVFQYAVNGASIPMSMQEAAKNLIFSVDEQLEHSKTKIESKCHITNAFPTVAWDGKVLHCCNMQKPTVGNASFLESSLQHFIAKRNSSPFCSSCMDNGVHRFFDVNVSIEEVDGFRHVVRV